jgi:anthranilate phosphoribosyltransferase
VTRGFVVHGSDGLDEITTTRLEGELGWSAAMRSPFKRHVEKLIEAERKKSAKR